MIENMFSERYREKEINSIDDCVEIDVVSKELWEWAASTERWGKVLFIGLIIWGIISSITGSFIYDEYAEIDGWNVLLFFTNIVQYAIYAYLEYIVYHAIALLLASLATITQNTRVTAKIAEYKVRTAGGADSDKNKIVDDTAENTDTSYSPSPSLAQEINNNKIKNGWTCSKCGNVNESYEIACKKCGQYK